MSLTVVTCSVVLNRRWGECAALADVQDALSWSAGYLNITPANVGVVVDNDVLVITSATYPQFIDVAEVRGIMTILNNLDPVNLTAIGVFTDPEKLRLKYQNLLDKRLSFIMKSYSVGLPTLAVGVINMNFQEQFQPGVSPLEY